MNLKVAEEYINAFGNLARVGNPLIVPANLTDIAGLVATATSIVKSPALPPASK